MKAFALSDLPPAFQRQALAQLGGGSARATPAKIEAPKDRLRQNHAGMNKTEAAFFEHLTQSNPAAHVYREPTLPIANGCRYKPDFLVATDATNGHAAPVAQVAAYEVKGHMRDDAAVKLKVAASAYPWIAFHLVTRAKGGAWQIQHILS